MMVRSVVGFALVALTLGVVSSAQAQDAAAVKRGKMLWVNRGCGSCHGVGKKMAGPDLAGVEVRRPLEWLDRWLKETEAMIASDSIAMAMVAEWKGIKMPQQPLTDPDIEALLAYIRGEEARMASKK